MGEKTDIQVQEAQRVPYRINPKRNTPRHIVVKMTKIKDKERILKAAREKQQITYKGTPIMLSADFSAEILQARKEWQTYNQEYSTQQGSCSDLMERSKVLQTGKS